MSSDIPLLEAMKFIGSKKELYQGVQRNGFWPPNIKSPICTVQFLINIMQGKQWCLKYQDARIRACPTPPKKEVLIQEVNSILRYHCIEFQIYPSMSPDIEWLLVVLGTLDPTHLFFDSTYRPEMPQRVSNRVQPTLQALQGFFDALPPSRVLTSKHQSKKGKQFMPRVFKKQQNRRRREQELDDFQMQQYPSQQLPTGRNPQSLVRPVTQQRIFPNQFVRQDGVETDLNQSFNTSFPQQESLDLAKLNQTGHNIGEIFASFQNMQSTTRMINQPPQIRFIDEASNEVSQGGVTESRSVTTRLNQFGLSPQKENRREEQSIGHQQKKKSAKKDQSTSRPQNPKPQNPMMNEIK